MKKIKLILIATVLVLCSCEKTTTDHEGRFFYGNDGKLYKAEDAPCRDCYRLKEVQEIDTAFTKLRLNK